MFTRTKALQVAEKIVQKLSPHVEVINIAGSIRREKTEVKDIEVVLIPKKQIFGTPDLFGEGIVEKRITAGFLSTVNDLGRVIKGLPSGRYMQIEITDGNQKIMLDMFMPQPVDYFRQYAVRTGSAEYASKTIAGAWVKNGWRGTEDGLRLETDCQAIPLPEKKVKWKCIALNPQLPPAWSSEKDFFEWLGIRWIFPKYRTF